jgi:tetratricopeptide (TPR) repeat protein
VAQEAKLFQIYDKAIKLQYDNRYDEARAHYEEVLAHELLASKLNAQSSLSKLLYLTLKNLAEVEYTCAQYAAALEHIARAVEIDASDSQMWYKLGVWALETYQRDIAQARDNVLLLARYSLETGVRINQDERGVSHDLPAFKYDDLLYLEQLLAVLYLIGDWAACRDVVRAVLAIDARHVLAIKFRALLDGDTRNTSRDMEDDTCHMEDEEVAYADHVIEQLQQLRAKRVKPEVAPEHVISGDSLCRSIKNVTWYELVSLLHVTYTDRLRNK